MPLSLRRGVVTAVLERHEGLARLEVDGAPCVAYPGLTGPVALGDEVVVNTQARDLGLGSGGFDIVYANLTRGLGLLPPSGAHVIALPYTPGQSAVACVEEHDPLSEQLDGLPVVCCGLHSQLAPVVAGIGSGVRIAYVQLAGGALPVALSDTVRLLKTRQLLETSVAVAPCFDGDVQALTTASALAWAKAKGFDNGVFIDADGHVGESSNMNVAFVTRDAVLAHPKFDHILSGCTSLRLLELADALRDEGLLKGVAVRDIPGADARASREMLLLGSSVKVAPIVQWDGQAIGDGRPGPVAKALLRLLEEDMRTSNRLIDVPY